MRHLLTVFSLFAISLSASSTALAAPSFLVCKNDKLTLRLKTTSGHEAIWVGDARAVRQKLIDFKVFRCPYCFEATYQSPSGRTTYTLRTKGYSGFAGWVIRGSLTKLGVRSESVTQLSCKEIRAAH